MLPYLKTSILPPSEGDLATVISASFLPKPPDWNRDEVAHSPPPPEPPDSWFCRVDAIRFYSTPLYDPFHIHIGV